MSEEQTNEQMIAEFPDTPASPVDAAPVSTPTPDPSKPVSYKYKTDGGKEVEEPLDMILKRASMGYHYSQRMAEVKQQMERAKQLEAENGKLSKWREYDEYATKNPQWNEHVHKMWNERGRFSDPNLDPNDPMAQRIAAIEAKYEERIAGMEKEFGTIKQYKELEKQAQEDGELDSEIQTIRSSYKDVDFDKPDEFGNSLEARVVDHAIKNGMKSFKSAFRDYYHDELISRANETAKEALLKDTQEKAKKGIIGKSPTSLMNGHDKAKNVRSRSYEDLAREALDEFSQ